MGAPRLDSVALFRALDEKRREWRLSWQQLAVEAGVAESTLKRTRIGGPMEADGVLAMVRLVGKAPEDFAEGVAVETARPIERGRFNTSALYAALDAERGRRGLSWPEVSREIGACTSDALKRLAHGGRTNADVMLACTWWLRREVNAFVDLDFEHPGESRRRRGTELG